MSIYKWPRMVSGFSLQGHSMITSECSGWGKTLSWPSLVCPSYAPHPTALLTEIATGACKTFSPSLCLQGRILLGFLIDLSVWAWAASMLWLTDACDASALPEGPVISVGSSFPNQFVGIDFGFGLLQCGNWHQLLFSRGQGHLLCVLRYPVFCICNTI